MQQQNESKSDQWFICEETGNRFQLPEGARCSECRKMFTTPYYLYVEMAPVCLKCRKKQVEKIMESLKPM